MATNYMVGVSDETQSWINNNSTKLQSFAKKTGNKNVTTRKFDNISDIVALVEAGYLTAYTYSKNGESYEIKDGKGHSVNVGQIPISLWNDFANKVVYQHTHQNGNYGYYSDRTNYTTAVNFSPTASQYISNARNSAVEGGGFEIITEKGYDKVTGSTVTESQDIKLKATMDNITKMISTRNHYAGYIVFSLHGYTDGKEEGKKNTVVDCVIDSRKNQTIASYFEYRKNGTGKANEFQIQLVFSPHTRTTNLLNEKNEIDPNLLELYLSQCCVGTREYNPNTSEDSGVQIDKEYINSMLWSCKIQYGYMVDGHESIDSPEYETMIVDYKVEFVNNQLIYTINGVSNVEKLTVYDKIKRPRIKPDENPVSAAVGIILDNVDNEEFSVTCGNLPNGEAIFATGDSVTKEYKSKFGEKYGDVLAQPKPGEWGSDKALMRQQILDNSVYCACVKTLKEYATDKIKELLDPWNLSEEQNKIDNGIVDIEANDTTNNKSEEEEKATQEEVTKYEKILEEGLPKSNKEQSLLEIVEELLSYAELSDNYSKTHGLTSSTDGTSLEYGDFTYSILDSYKSSLNSNMQKNAIHLEFEKDVNLYDEKVDADKVFYTFEWLDSPHQNKNIVVNFQTNSSGAFVKSALNTATDLLTDRLTAVDTETGETYVVGDTGAEVLESGDYAPWYRLIREFTYKQKLMELGNYTATLTTIGIPAEIPILSLLELDIYMNGQKHYLSGIYRVLSITDRFDSGGFITVFDLIKVPKKPYTVEEMVSHIRTLVTSIYPNILIQTQEELNGGDSDPYKSASSYYKYISNPQTSKVVRDYWKNKYDKYKKGKKNPKSFEKYVKSYYKKYKDQETMPITDSQVKSINDEAPH